MEKVLKFIGWIVICIIVAISNSFAGEAVFFYHTDPAGTPLAMTNASGSVVWRADYLPFGEENVVTGTMENDKKFVGKEQDEETGLYYFGARYMEPRIGRFISPDLVGPVDPRTGKVNEKILLNPQRINLYAYGLNNPYRYIDPDGNTVWDIADVGFFAYDVYKFARDPSWSNAGDLALDAVGLLPLIPSVGLIKAAGKGIDKAIDASKTVERAENAADAVRLKKSLASEQQMKEVGKAIAGAGTEVPLREADRLSKTYGGNPSQWAKKTSSSFTVPDGARFETHWYENAKTGQRIEYKTKIIE